LVNSELPQRRQRIAQFVPDCLQYASRNWLNHIVAMKHDASGVIGLLRQFLFLHLLHWVELSSLLGEFDAVLPSLNRLHTWLGVCSTFSPPVLVTEHSLPFSVVLLPMINFLK
jgi:hypothetical protein